MTDANSDPASSGFQPPSLSAIRKQLSTLEVAERFFESSVLFALHELGVFRALADGPRDHAALYEAVGGDAETLRGILDAAVALKVLAKEGEAYAADEALLDSLGRPGSPSYLGEWVSFLHVLARPILDLHVAEQTGKPPGNLVEDGKSDNILVRRMTDAMDAYARTRGVEMVEHLDFSGDTTFLDLGCGPGTYSLAVVERFPNVQATLLDLDIPIQDARRIVAARGMTDRVSFVVSDAFSYQPERGYDVVLISNTLHMLGPELSAKLLARCYDLVNPGGRLIVQAQFLHDERTSPRWPTLVNLVQRVATIHGRNHALGETESWLRDAGFAEVEHVRFSAWNVNSAMIGHRAP